RQDMETLIRGLEAAFAYFGGVPAELLFDQMRAVVNDDRRGEGGSLILNAEFLRFAEHWAFDLERVDRTEHGPRARSSGRSATVARASSTHASSSAMTTSTPRRCVARGGRER